MWVLDNNVETADELSPHELSPHGLSPHGLSPHGLSKKKYQ